MIKKKPSRINHRLEKDGLGLKAIPKSALYGIRTVRAFESLPVSTVKLCELPDFISSMAIIRRSCAQTNAQLGFISAVKSRAIIEACDELIVGAHHENCVVDFLQGSLSSLENVDEVVANLALLNLGRQCGEYEFISPQVDISGAQSAHQVYSASIRIGLLMATRRLIGELRFLADELGRNGSIFANQFKVSGQRLTDAQKEQWNQKILFHCLYIRGQVEKLITCSQALTVISMVNKSPAGYQDSELKYCEMTSRNINEVTKLGIIVTSDEVAPNQIDILNLSGILKSIAVGLSQCHQDLHDMIVQFVNERSTTLIASEQSYAILGTLVSQVLCEVVGNDVTVALASDVGRTHYAHVESVAAWSTLKSVCHIESATTALRTHFLNDSSSWWQLLIANIARSPRDLASAMQITQPSSPGSSLF